MLQEHYLLLGRVGSSQARKKIALKLAKNRSTTEYEDGCSQLFWEEAKTILCSYTAHLELERGRGAELLEKIRWSERGSPYVKGNTTLSGEKDGTTDFLRD